MGLLGWRTKHTRTAAAYLHHLASGSLMFVTGSSKLRFTAT